MSATVKSIVNNYRKLNLSKSILDMVPSYLDELPDGVCFDDVDWDVLSWQKHKGNSKTFYLGFQKIKNYELCLVTKLYVLERRKEAKLYPRTLNAYVDSIAVLSDVIEGKSFESITNSDFESTELKLLRSIPLSAHNKTTMLQTFGRWLNETFGLRISYVTRLKNQNYHGRKGVENGRMQKRINYEVIRQLVAASHRKDISDVDRFFLSALMINFTCGFRINEMTTLPVKLLSRNGNEIQIRYFAEKGGVIGVRPIAPAIVPSIEKALRFITKYTEPGRRLVANLRKKWKEQPTIDWSYVLQDDIAAKYFAEKFAHEWTSKPMHNLFCKLGGWFEKEKKYIDVLALLEKYGALTVVSSKTGICRSTLYRLKEWQEAAIKEELPLAYCINKGARGKLTPSKKISWDTDSRVISIIRFEEYAKKKVMPGGRRELIRHVIEEAQSLQLQGKVYPMPDRNEKFENKYRYRVRPVLEVDGKAWLEPEDALFVIREKELSNRFSSKNHNYQLVDDSMFHTWLNGRKSSLGTGKSDDSVFNRLNIIDPETGTIARFVWHDIRHWLNTIYQEGGLTEEKIGLIFSRNPLQNHVYDQTSASTRLEQLRNVVRDDKGYGILQDNYNRIAEYSRDEAENYLQAKTIMIRVMPHGGCTHNFVGDVCPHHNSCFVREDPRLDGVCEHLNIDDVNIEQIKEIERLYQENDLAMKLLPDNSRQHAHAMKVKRNLDILLSNSPTLRVSDNEHEPNVELNNKGLK